MSWEQPKVISRTFYSADDKFSMTVDRSGSWMLCDLSNGAATVIDEYTRDYNPRNKRTARQMAQLARFFLEKKGIQPKQSLIDETDRLDGGK